MPPTGHPYWLVIRLPVDEGMWLPGKVEKEAGLLNSLNIREGGPFTNTLTLTMDMGELTLYVRCGNRKRLARVAAWVMSTSEGADIMFIHSLTRPALPAPPPR